MQLPRAKILVVEGRKNHRQHKYSCAFLIFDNLFGENPHVMSSTYLTVPEFILQAGMQLRHGKWPTILQASAHTETFNFNLEANTRKEG